MSTLNSGSHLENPTKVEADIGQQYNSGMALNNHGTSSTDKIVTSTHNKESDIELEPHENNSKNGEVKQAFTPQKLKSSKKRKKKVISPEEEVVFNYMTGCYEKVKKIKMNDYNENQSETVVIGNKETPAINTIETITMRSEPEESSNMRKANIIDLSAGDGCVTQNMTTDINEGLTCQICLFEALSRQQLMFHLYEVHLQEAYSISFKCKICNFETNDKKLMALHDKTHADITETTDLSKNVKIQVCKKSGEYSDCDGENTGICKCFDCDYTAGKKYSLQNHVIRHMDSKFTCTKHADLTRNCRMCIYKSCLLNLKTKMLTCGSCDFKTCRRDRFEDHKRSSIACVNRILQLSYPDEENTGINYCLHNIFKCFDCQYKANRRAHLRHHVIRHKDSKFTCNEHSTLKNHCDGCIYQSCLLNLKNNLKTCDICTYKTFVSKRFKAHQLGHKRSQGAADEDCSDSDNLRPEYYKCFDCNYETHTKWRLQKHVVQHDGSKFICPKHLVVRNGCLKCVYERCLMDLQAKMMTCKKCDYKTCSAYNFKDHQSKSAVCSRRAEKNKSD